MVLATDMIKGKKMDQAGHRKDDMRRAILATLAGALVLLVGACDDGASAPKKAAAPKPAKKEAVADPVPAAEAAKVVELETFDYRPDILPDPFEPYVEIEADVGIKGPLEYYDLGEIRIKGIISGIRDARAKVVAGGEVYTIRRGTPIGKNHGRVIAIRTDEIIIRERYRDEVTRGYKYIETNLKME